MRKILALLVTFVLVLAFTSQAIVGQERAPVIESPAQEPNNDDSRKWLYDDEQVFDQLSSAAQIGLERQFGKKPPKPKDPGLPLESEDQTLSLTLAGAVSNQRVNDPAADTTSSDTQSETTIVLGTGSNIVSAFNDSGSSISTSHKFTGFSRSTNGGMNWRDGGTLPTNTQGDMGDPVLARNNSTRRIYLSTIQDSGSGLRIFRSNDEAATWLDPIQGAPALGTGDFADKEWIAVDNFSGSGNGNVYVVFRNFIGPMSTASDGILFTRSTNNGDTFTPNGGLAVATSVTRNTGLQGAYVAVGPDHSVYVFWIDQTAGTGTNNIIKMRRSTDQGGSFGSTIDVATLRTTSVSGGLGSIGGFRSNSYPQVAVNPASGNLYLVYNDINAAGTDRGNVFLRQSTDNGSTWGAATQLNNDTTTNPQFFPTIAVTPDGTKLASTWYDKRSDPMNLLIEYWGVCASISGNTLTFGPNFAISDQFPAVVGLDTSVGSTYMGDYDQIVADNSNFYVTWGDNRDDSTFPGAMRKNANVRFAKFPPILGAVAPVNAARYNTPLAPESIVAAFGSNLATGTFFGSDSDPITPGIQLPTLLGGTVVKVTDSTGFERAAPLFFVSPLQVNFLMPTETALGKTSVLITSGDGRGSVGVVQVTRVAPGLFSANSDGAGVPAGSALRVRADGSQAYEGISAFDPSVNRYVPFPIDLGPATEQVFLILYGTGIRNRVNLPTATIGGVAAQVVFAGAQGDFVGTDQINILLPRALLGRGVVPVTLTVDGVQSNALMIDVN